MRDTQTGHVDRLTAQTVVYLRALLMAHSVCYAWAQLIAGVCGWPQLKQKERESWKGERERKRGETERERGKQREGDRKVEREMESQANFRA